MNGKKLKANNGISMADVIIALTILCLFVGVVGNLYYQIIKESEKVRYNAVAVYYVIKIAEDIDKMSYTEVTNDLNTNLKETYQIPDGITITLNVQNYNATDASKEDILKTVKISANYECLGDNMNYEIKKLKIKEM